jgi:hypothetical protein
MIRRDNVSGSITVNGFVLTESRTRGLFRFLAEGSAPTEWAGDDWCVSVGVHLDDFIRYAEDIMRVCPWASGEAPPWEEAPLTDADWAEIEKASPIPSGVYEDAFLVA